MSFRLWRATIGSAQIYARIMGFGHLVYFNLSKTEFVQNLVLLVFITKTHRFMLTRVNNDVYICTL